MTTTNYEMDALSTACEARRASDRPVEAVGSVPPRDPR